MMRSLGKGGVSANLPSVDLRRVLADRTVNGGSKGKPTYCVHIGKPRTLWKNRSQGKIKPWKSIFYRHQTNLRSWHCHYDTRRYTFYTIIVKSYKKITG
jgi:hypothetical protein